MFPEYVVPQGFQNLHLTHLANNKPQPQKSHSAPAREPIYTKVSPSGTWPGPSNRVKTKKFFLVPKSQENFFASWPAGPSLDTIRSPGRCVDTQLASELLSANFLF